MYCRIWYVDLLLHFSGDIGSPTVLSSITCSSIRVKSGSPSSMGFRPPPDFRTLPSSAARFPLPRSSPIPFRMVGLERPLSSPQSKRLPSHQPTPLRLVKSPQNLPEQALVLPVAGRTHTARIA